VDHADIVSDAACSQAKVVSSNAAVIVKAVMATWLLDQYALNNHSTAIPGLLLVTTALSMLTTGFILFILHLHYIGLSTFLASQLDLCVGSLHSILLAWVYITLPQLAIASFEICDKALSITKRTASHLLTQVLSELRQSR